jgi:hypothetical protein
MLAQARKESGDCDVFFPQLFKSFRVDDRLANAYLWNDNLRSIQAIKDANPSGVNGRHVVWIIRRLLLSAALCHANGVVYANYLPHNVHFYIEPGTKPQSRPPLLFNWTSATEAKNKLEFIHPEYEDFYHPDIFEKKSVKPIFDIYMIGKLGILLMDGSVDPKIQGFLRGCCGKLDSTAIDLYDDLTSIAKRVYGKRKYEPLELGD